MQHNLHLLVPDDVTSTNMMLAGPMAQSMDLMRASKIHLGLLLVRYLVKYLALMKELPTVVLLAATRERH